MKEEESKTIILENAQVVHSVICSADRYGKCTVVVVFMTPDHDTYVWRTGTTPASGFPEGGIFTIKARLEDRKHLTNVSQVKKPLIAKARLEDYKTEQRQRSEGAG